MKIVKQNFRKYSRSKNVPNVSLKAIQLMDQHISKLMDVACAISLQHERLTLMDRDVEDAIFSFYKKENIEEKENLDPLIAEYWKKRHEGL